MKEIIFYKTKDGKEPFKIWFESLTDKITIKKIYSRMQSVKCDNFGVHHGISQGVQELRFKNGIRIYYGIDNNILVILLVGGNKYSQTKDIKLSINYWMDYKNRYGGK